jgi:putative glutamine amidotransferase
MTSAPLIGLTADHETRSNGPTEAEYALRQNYCAAVARAGGLPVILPYEQEDLTALVARLDGLIITGGMFDLPPEMYGQPPDPAVTTKPQRTRFEQAVLGTALARDIPVLGICNGMQLLAVHHGGTLVADILRDVPGGIEHLPQDPPVQTAHGIDLCPGSSLHAIHGSRTAKVNSLHHQSVRDDGAYRVAARSQPDGVIEAIEVAQHRFALGVQWHPEYGLSDLDHALMQAFIDATREVRT